MKNKKTIFSIILLLCLPFLAQAVTIDFANPIDSTGTATEFFQNIITGILNIIAYLGVLFIVIAGVVYLIASSTGNEALVETAKKIWTGSLIGIALGLAGPVFLKQIKEIVLKEGEMPTKIGSALTLTQIVSNTLEFLLSIIGILAIISLVINSMIYLFSSGNQNQAEKAKKNISLSIFGFIIAGSSLILVRLIVWFIENPR